MSLRISGRALLAATFTLCLSTTPAILPAQTYVIRDLGVLSGGSYSSAFGINANGQVAGYSVGTGFSYHAFGATATGKISDPGADLGAFDAPGNESNANGINASGQVAGWSIGSGSMHAFRTTAMGKVSDPGAD